MITNDARTVTGSPRTLRIAGGEYRIYPLTPEDFGKLQDWVDRQFPDPYALAADAINSGKFTIAQQQYILKTAMEQAARGSHPIGTPEADEKLYGMNGVMELLFVAISKGDPSFDRAKAEELARTMNFAEVAQVFSATNADLVISDPKAPTSGATSPDGMMTT